jgi:hypothetical protein
MDADNHDMQGETEEKYGVLWAVIASSSSEI